MPLNGEMAGPAATGTLERLDGERAALVAWVAGRFRGRLTLEDAEDVVAEALPRLAADPRLPDEPRPADRYVRRALWRDALDELRRRHGRELDRWDVGLEHAPEQREPDGEPEHRLVDLQERVAAQAAAARVLARLRGKDAQLLRRRFLDGVPTEALAAELGLGRSGCQRRIETASRLALDALVDAHSGDVCPQIRRLIEESPTRLLDRDQAGRRDAHLDECVHCRAFSLRARGALELLPLPAAGLLERLSARIGGLLGRGGESVSALKDSPEALGGGAAGAAGAGAGTALGAGLGAKVVIGCTGAAVAVMCAAPLGVMPITEREPLKREAAAKPRPKAAKAARAAVNVAAPVAPTVAQRRAGEQTGERRGAPRPSRSPARARRPSAAQEFGPEASRPADSAGVPRAAASGGEFEPSPPAARSEPAASTPSSSSFAGEFAP